MRISSPILIPGVVTEIVNTIDVNTGEEKPAALLKKNEIAVCKISLADVIVETSTSRSNWIVTGCPIEAVWASLSPTWILFT